MKKFDKIVVLDKLNSNVLDSAKSEIEKLSKAEVHFPNHDIKSEDEIIKKIGNADCVLLSWKTVITEKILDSCPNIKYVGVAATSIANIPVNEVKRRGIALSNVADYGDESTAEYIFARLLILARGLEGAQWKEDRSELNKKTLGIIGLGAVGKQVALRALGFNMNVLYTQRHRNTEYEKRGLKYKQLNYLLKNSDIISIHVPKNVMVLTSREFKLIPNDAILVNTSNGVTLDQNSFLKWIRKGKNFAIFDYDGLTFYPKIKPMKNIILGKQTAGRTIESKERLSSKFINNIRNYLNS